MTDFAEALACAMAIVPNAYSRNKMYAFFDHASVRRARARSRAMRSLAHELAGRLGAPSDLELEGDDARGYFLRYRLASVRMWRIAELTRVELACVIHLARQIGRELPFARGDELAVVKGVLLELPQGIRPA